MLLVKHKQVKNKRMDKDIMVIPIKAKMSLDKVGFRTKDIARNKEYEIVQSLWKVLRQFLVQLNIHISYDLDILIFTREKKNCPYKDLHKSSQQLYYFVVTKIRNN